MKNRVILIGFLFLVTFITHASTAAIVRWSFAASVEAFVGDAVITNALITGGVGFDSQITGFLEFDTDTADVSPPSELGYYPRAVFAAQLSFGEYSATVDLDSFYRTIAVTNDEEDALEGIVNQLIDGQDQWSSFFSLKLFDSTGTFVDNDEIPEGDYGLEDFDAYDINAGFPSTTGLFLFVSDGVNLGRVEARLTEFTVSSVPIPSSAILLLTGLITLFGYRR